MKKQMRFKKGILGVAVIAIIAAIFFSTKSMNNVEAKEKTCTNAQELQSYYKVAYTWSDDDKSLIFSTKHGSFRIIGISHPQYFKHTFTKDSDGYYKVDNKEATLDNKHKLVLSIKDVKSLNIQNEEYGFTMKLALSKNDSEYGCLSMAEFNKKKSGATFETGTIEIELPKSAIVAAAPAGEDNTNYNRACKALREGTDPTGKINQNDVDYMKLYNASYRTEYKQLLPDCWKTKVTSNYSEADMLDMVRITLSSVYEKNHLSVGDGATDNGSAWLINFNAVKEAAQREDALAKTNAEKHVFYTDAARKFYTSKGGSLVFDFANTTKDEHIGMKCNIKAKSNTDYTNLLEHLGTEDNPIYNINANIQHYYAKNVITQQVTYIWNYTKGNTLDQKDKEVTKNACTRTCEEAVEVKYGPPVASKAGLCFEYQVQVTSRVKCTADIKITQTTEPTVCQPIPYCNSVPGYIHQAGGNDEFAECIHKCDGGKYTKSCSEKCYKKVYENKSNKTANTGTTTAARKLGLSNSWFAGHYKWSNGAIVWVSEGSHSTYARYYKLYEYGRTSRDHGKYTPSGGFKKHILSDGSLCKDKCSFKKCGQKRYLNSSEAHKDYLANLKRYNEAIAKCKASASCTTKTATFTIKTDYKNAQGEVVTVNYPYTGNNTVAKEKLKSSDSESACNNPIGVTHNNDIILKFAGCYSKCGQGLQYHTRWSFPGSWLNKKTGELSFVPKNGVGWEKRPEKFCIPFDAQDVNAKWWKYYYSLYNRNHITSYRTSETVSTKCWSISTGTSEIATLSDIEKWNIKASTRNFGYYGWNFDIECFYALNTKLTKTNTETSSVAIKCNNPKQAYKIRTVDLKNLFPDSSQESGQREPGFNWSQNANIVASNGKKNPNNQSIPSLYAEKVQNEGYNIYSNNNLDYEFELTKEMIKKVKSGDRNYTSFNGEMVVRNGMNSYQSDVIRKGLFASSNNKVLNAAAIGCNNVDNYRSTVCTNIREEGN